jgi:hypothetical protein
VALNIFLAAALPGGVGALAELGDQRRHPLVVPPEIVAFGIYVCLEALHGPPIIAVMYFRTNVWYLDSNRPMCIYSSSP